MLTREAGTAVRDTGFSCVSGRDGSSLNIGKGRLRTAHGPFPQQITMGVGVPNIVIVQVLCQIQLSVRQELARKIQHFLKICIHAYEVNIFSINSVHHDKVLSKPSLKTWLSLRHEGGVSPLCVPDRIQNPSLICRSTQQAQSILSRANCMNDSAD